MRTRPPSKRKKNDLKTEQVSRSAAHARRGNESSDDDLDDEQVAEYLRHKKKKYKKMDPHQAGVAMRLSLDRGEPSSLTDAEYEFRVAFCCKVCHCSKKVKAEYKDSEYMQASAELVLWHRRCCHRDEEHDEAWASPYLCCLQEAQEHLFAEPCPNCKKPERMCKVCRTEALEKEGIDKVDPKAIYMKYLEKVREGNRRTDEDQHSINYDRLRSNPAYVAHHKMFRKEQAQAKREPQSKAAVVVDLFGGIGSAIVALKRLNIAISKIIHVEHDKVANYVYKYWNCLEGNQENDGIKHIFIPSFKTFQSNLNLLLEMHGPFDIIIGAPPYMEYTGINFPKKSVGKKQESDLCAMGLMVKEIQRHNQSRNCKLFFLAESAVILNDREHDMGQRDLNQAAKAFGIEWHVTLDSRDHSPLHRKRTYITNIPVLKPLDVLDPPPSLCFDDEFDLAEMIFDPEVGNPKVASLMASQTLLDDHPRMSIYKEHMTRELKFFRRTPTVAERERLMGLPPNYVSRPLEKLYTNLVSNGFAPEALDVNKHWMDCLAEEFHEFAGDYHGFHGRGPAFYFYTAERSDSDCIPAVKVKLAPPTASKQPKHYTEKEYAKRLIGNAFSIPTMEFLLQPLTPFFGKRRYSTVDYVFAWAGWNPADDESPKRSERVKRLMHEVADDQDEENEEGSTCEPTVASSGYNSSATLIVTTLAHARESLGKLSLPPASAMEEVDRRLMSGANDVEDDENDEEDFDV